MFGAVASCSDAGSGVDGRRVLSHCLLTLAHKNVQYHLSDLDHQFAVIIISIDTVGGGDELKEFLSSTKDSFLAISKYRGIILISWTSRSVCSAEEGGPPLLDTN